MYTHCIEAFVSFLRNTKARTKETTNLLSVLFLNTFNNIQIQFKMSK